MLLFAANLSLLFTELPFVQRIDAAARAGFDAVECQFPYGVDAAELRARLDGCGLAMFMHNLPAGDWAAGERGIACLPGRESEFRAGVAQGVTSARALGVKRLNCLAGVPGPEVPPQLAHETLVANLRFAAHVLADAGMTLLVEPLNSVDVPGFFLTRSAQVLDILDEVGAVNAMLQFDLYHAQRMEGDLSTTLARHLPRIGHIQIADCPGRHEPGSGELHWDFLFEQLDRLGWRTPIGCEYIPRDGTTQGLEWLQAARARLAQTTPTST